MNDRDPSSTAASAGNPLKRDKLKSRRQEHVEVQQVDETLSVDDIPVALRDGPSANKRDGPRAVSTQAADDNSPHKDARKSLPSLST